MKEKKFKSSIFISFLIWPFGTFLYVLKHFRKSIARPIFILAISFLGFTANSEGDLQRYEELFYTVQNQSLGTIISSLLELKKIDIYVDILALFTSVFNSHHYYFAVLFGVFAYLLSGIIIKFLELLPKTFSRNILLLFIGFVLFYSIRSVISVRFYTGGLYFLLMMINYLITGKKKYILYSFITPFFHFGLALLILSGPLLIILRKRYYFTIILVILSFSIGQTTVIGFLGSKVSNYDDTFIEQKFKTYASDEGRTRMEENYEEGRKKLNWKVHSLTHVRNALWYWLILGLAISFLKRKILFKNRFYEDLYIFILIIFSFSNLMLNISNGDRYIYLYLFPTLGLFLLLLSNVKLPKLLLRYIFILIPLSIIYGVMTLYATNPLFTLEFFFLNFPSAIFLAK